jgi:hypothetical protein
VSVVRGSDYSIVKGKIKCYK